MINKIKEREQLFNRFFDAFQVWFNKHYENKKIDKNIMLEISLKNMKNI